MQDACERCLAIAQAKSGAFGAAEALYREVLAQYPAHKRARAALSELKQAQARASAPVPAPLLHEMIALMNAGRYGELVAATGRLLRRSARSVQLLELRAAGLSGLGDAAGAAALYRELIAIRPDHADTHGNLGNALMELGDDEAAAAQFARVLELRPNDATALNNMGNATNRMGQREAALRWYQQAVAVAPTYFYAQLNLGNLLFVTGQIAQARHHLEAARALAPRNAQALNDLANVLLVQGETAQAAENYDAALRIAPDFAEAYWNRTPLHRFTPEDPAIAQMQALLEAPETPERNRIYLGFALGKAWDDCGDVARAFACWRDANARRKAELGYDIAQDRARFAHIKACFATPHPVIAPEDGDRAPAPIFILGLPRSGTTLVEQIVSCHSWVAPGGEIPELESGLDHLDWSTPEALSLAGAQIRARYQSALVRLGGDARFVSDKMPANFRWIGAIKSLFPKAKIVHLQRDPRAVLWSNYRNFFTSTGNGFAHDLDDLVQYHALYKDLMAHWHSLYGGEIFDLQYEHLTQAPETVIRDLLAYLELPFEAACLRPQNNTRAVMTTSTTQVRRAIYTGSSQDWQRYDAYLQTAYAKLDP